MVDRKAYRENDMRTAIYKGREYRLDYLGATRFGRRAKLSFMNGRRTFWVDAERVREIDPEPMNLATDHGRFDDEDYEMAIMEAERANERPPVPPEEVIPF
jgi:hypothetical protein